MASAPLIRSTSMPKF